MSARLQAWSYAALHIVVAMAAGYLAVAKPSNSESLLWTLIMLLQWAALYREAIWYSAYIQLARSRRER